jgi:hypothetical protein
MNDPSTWNAANVSLTKLIGTLESLTSVLDVQSSHMLIDVLCSEKPDHIKIPVRRRSSYILFRSYTHPWNV